MTPFETKRVPVEYDKLAPDGSEIRLLPKLAGGSMSHCQLPVGGVTQAVTHQTVEELWYVVAGKGQIWRKQGEREEITSLEPRIAITIPLGTIFQFRNLGDVPLEIIIVTMPPWPDNDDEAIPQENHWER